MYDISTTERDYEALEAWPASVPLNAYINCSRTLFLANFLLLRASRSDVILQR